MLATTALSLLVISPTVHAAEGTTAETLKALQEQVALMQKQLEDMQVKVKKAEIKSKAAEAKAEATEAKVEEQAKAVATAKPADKSAEGVQKEILPGVKVTLGGFVQTDAIYRSKNQTADSASSFNTGIPFDNSVNAHQSEFRGSARQTRLSLLAEGDPDADTKLKAFVAMDFMGAAPTANSIETNSY
ncbi:MAG: hypothetical protein HGA90_06000, partial [Alphaproteobacteria bacterium]|nr:hypothetical protein [Alphaproteobacteria bacterium]